MNNDFFYFRGVLCLTSVGYSEWIKEAKRVADEDIEIRVISGLKCETLDAMYDCFVEEFGFPDYFGRNPNALMDSMRMIAPISKNIFILKIEQAFNFLSKEPAEDLSEIMYFFSGIADEWSRGLKLGLSIDYDPKNFLVIFVHDIV